MHHVKMFFDIFYNFRLCLYFVKKNSILAAFEQVNTILRKSKKNVRNSRDPVLVLPLCIPCTVTTYL